MKNSKFASNRTAQGWPSVLQGTNFKVDIYMDIYQKFQNINI